MKLLKRGELDADEDPDCTQSLLESAGGRHVDDAVNASSSVPWRPMRVLPLVLVSLLATVLLASALRLLPWLEHSTSGTVFQFSAAIDTRSRTHAPPLLHCSAAHIRQVSQHLYDTTPVESTPFADIRSLADHGIDSAHFTTSVKYNPAFPTQVYNNVCLLPHGSNRLVIFSGNDGLNGTEKRNAFLRERNRQLNASGEQPHTLLQHFWFEWHYGSQPDQSWKYLPGTTILERKLRIYHQANWNFGHCLGDFIQPYLMNFVAKELTRVQHPIDRIIVDSGCMDEQSPYLTPPVNHTVPIGTRRPLVRAAPTVEPVWPVISDSYATFQWMMRMMLRAVDGSGHRRGAVLDSTWDNVRLFHSKSGSRSFNDTDCRSEIWDQPLCFERFLVVGRQEDRGNSMAGHRENRRMLHILRNQTLQTFGFDSEPVLLPFNSSHWNANNTHTLLAALAQQVNSTVTPALFLHSYQRQLTLLPKPRVLLYGREDANRRIWLNIRDTVTVLSQLPSIELTYLHSMGSLSLCQQMSVFSQHDIFIMPHGAGLYGLLWAPERATVIEVFPHKDIDWTWIHMLIDGLELDWQRTDGEHAVSMGRAGGQDDSFHLQPSAILQLLAQRGIDVTSAKEHVAQN